MDLIGRIEEIAKQSGNKITYRIIPTEPFTPEAERAEKLGIVSRTPENAGGGKELLCPMPGLVVDIPVTPGQEVKSGETVAIIEAMKMQNILKAERDGKVKAVKAKGGDPVAADDVLVEFE